MSETDVSTAVYAKTALGQDEIQNRVLRLPLLLRRVLLLVDGRRDAEALAELTPGHDARAMLGELLDQGGIAEVALPKPAAARAAPRPAADAPPAESATVAALDGLPPAEARSAKQVEMARNFMINTINTLLEANTRLTLVKQIFDSAGAAELRRQYPAWEEAIGSAWIGSKRLPELRKKLFAVL